MTEGIWPSFLGKSGPGIPGLVTPEQTAGWREVTTAVHAAGGRIFAQLWHAGRVSHPLVLGGESAVSASAVRAPGTIYVAGGMVETVTPRALGTTEIEELVTEYVLAARNAIAAGFDGVEIHSANGYLLHGFLAENTNLRTDRYRERTRFPLEVAAAVAAEVGAERVGFRISPGNPENDLEEPDWPDVYRPLVRELSRLGLAYLHIVSVDGQREFAELRPHWNGLLIGNLHQGAPSTQAGGERLLAEGLADMAAFGRLFIGNPDLPVRFATGAPLVHAEHEHFYGSALSGYVDFPPSALLAAS